MKFSAQEVNSIRSYTVDDGLPSNHVYDLCEDKDGFLWVTTDNGVSRFDGINFINYSTKDGLPSNDVLQIVESNDGIIWVNCYKQAPCYFDKKKNRFVSFENNSTISKISGELFQVTILPKGGVLFTNSVGAVHFKNTQIHWLSDLKRKRYYLVDDKRYELIYKHFHSFSTIEIYENKIQREAFRINTSYGLTGSCIHENESYSFIKDHLYRIRPIQKEPLKWVVDSLAFEEELAWFKLFKSDLFIISKSGNIYIYDKNSLKLKQKLKNDQNANSAIRDVNNNIWVGTSERGLMLFHSAIAKNINLPEIVGSNFQSVYRTAKNELVAGSFDNQLIFYDLKSGSLRSKGSMPKSVNKVRGIYSFQEKIIAISDEGVSFNGEVFQAVLANKTYKYPIKTGLKFDDNTLFLGTNYGILQYNVATKKHHLINAPEERISCIEKKDEHHIYFIASKGVYEYDLISKQSELVFANSQLKNERIALLNQDHKQRLWCSTFKGKLICVKNGKLLLSIKNVQNMPENITQILSVKNNLWISSKSGLYQLDFSHFPNYSIRRLTHIDGLSSNSVNSVFHYNDTLYCATDKGISFLPTKIHPTKHNINPLIVAISINNRIVPIKKSYSLHDNEKNVLIRLAGIELTGHFKKFQYKSNSTEEWTDLVGNTLNLSLNTGSNSLFIRGIDTNDNISPKQLSLIFHVAIPFYYSFWFWIIIVIVLLALIFWRYNRQKLKKQQLAFQQQLALEQQRTKITADLHDDIGSTLSSLQINSAVANQLLEKNPKEAQVVLQKIENQSKNLAEKIGDIIWSMKPGKEEFISMSSRIKNFANDILGSREIFYSIDIDPSVNLEITDITMRKNIVLLTKEALNNAAKYSQAKRIDVVLKKTGRSIYLSIQDDGIGFDTESTTGNGLSNMQKRVNELNGTFHLISSKNEGTKIEAVLPCP